MKSENIDEGGLRTHTVNTDVLVTMLLTRVRTILVLGYWVLGNIHRYWVVLVIGGYFLLF